MSAGDARTRSPSISPLRFSLLALFLFVTLVCLLVAWWSRPNRVVATALFRVSRVQPTVLEDATAQPEDAQKYEIVKKTQLALLKSYYVLDAAVRKPGIAALPVLANQDDPVDWLERNLQVGYPEDSEILEISLRGPEGHASDLVRIVDAVANAYNDEVVFKDRQRHLAERDLLARSLSELKSNIGKEWEEFIDLSHESGQSEIVYDAHQHEADIKLLPIIQSSILRWEDEAVQAKLSGDAAKLETLNERIAELQKDASQLEKRIAFADKPSLLSTRKRELVQLQMLANDVARKLQRLEIEDRAPQRIEQIQKAAVSPE